VESKIQDLYRQPLFQWNWWFEVTSNDRELDAKMREEYWKYAGFVDVVASAPKNV